jgi:hypothetical protein
MWNSGTWPPCTSDRADPVDAVQRRLQIVGGDLPQARLRNRVLAAIVRGERVAEDGKGREGQAVGGDARRCGQRLRDLGERCIRQLQRAEHIHIPIEEEADLRRAAAGGAAHRNQAGTLLMASSIGLVMVTCICSTGMTPLSTPITTRGKLVSGKTEIGTWNAA